MHSLKLVPDPVCSPRFTRPAALPPYSLFHACVVIYQSLTCRCLPVRVFATLYVCHELRNTSLLSGSQYNHPSVPPSPRPEVPAGVLCVCVCVVVGMLTGVLRLVSPTHLLPATTATGSLSFHPVLAAVAGYNTCLQSEPDCFVGSGK